jgi:hypothetical protein
MNEQSMLKPALTGGVLLGILSAIPVISAFNCVCCAWVIGGGVLAAYLYVKESPVPVTLGRGVSLGLFTGIIGTVVYGLFMIPLYLLMNRAGTGIFDQVREAIQRVPNLPPEAEEALRNLSNKEGMGMVLFVLGFAFSLVVFCLAAMLGSAVGVALFEKRKAGAPPYTPPPPEPPIHFPPPPPDA